ncbi:hypothetical protein AgCh_022070 [Apium graveolens]
MNKSAALGASKAASNNTPTVRTFNMIVQDAMRDSDVIAGLKSKPLKEPLQVEISNHEVIPVNQIHPAYELGIGEQSFSVDLIPFKLGKFDVILGMDWLSSNDAQIDCKGKKVKLNIPRKKEVIFRGKRQTHKFFTMTQAKKMLQK